MATKSRKLTTSTLYLCTLAFVPLVIFTFTLDSFNTPKAITFFCLTIGTLVHFLLSNASKLFSRKEKQITALLLMLWVGTLLASLLSDTTMARIIWGYPGRANGFLYYSSLFLAVYLGMKIVLEKDFSSRFYRTLNFVFTFNTLYALLQYFELDPIGWDNPYRSIIGTFGNPNFASAFLGVGTFFYTYRFIHLKSRVRYLFFVMAILAGFLTFETGSIQGPAIILATLSLLFANYLKNQSKNSYFWAFILLLTLGGSTFSYSFLGFGPFGDSLYQYTLKLRVEYWLIGIKTGLNWPFTGVGTDSYIEGFKLLRPQSFVDQHGPNLTADSAHNVPINFLANFGIFNFILLMLLVGLITTRAVVILFTKIEVQNFAQVASIIWLGMLAQSIFSIEQVGLGVFQWMIGALLLNSNLFVETSNDVKSNIHQTPQNSSKLGRETTFEFRGELSLLAIIGCIILVSPVIREEITIKKLIMANIGPSNPQEIIDEKIKTLSYITRDEIRRGHLLVDILLKAGRTPEAEAVLLQIVERDPQAIDALRKLAQIQRFYNRVDRELLYRESIYSLDKWSYENLLSMVEASAILGDIEKAKLYSERLMEFAPNAPEAESATAIVKGLMNNG